MRQVRISPVVGFAALSCVFAVGVVLTSCSDGSAKARPNFVFKKAPSDDVVAKIGGENITLEELITEDRVTYMDLQTRLYDYKMRRLRDIMVDRLIGKEAKAANMPLQEFIDKKIVKGDITISDKEIKEFAEERRIPESQMNDRLKDRIKDYIREVRKEEKVDAYVAKLTKSAPVEVYFDRPRMEIEVAQAPTWGEPSAKVTIVEFSDFQCPYCSKGAETLKEVKKKYKGKVKIAFKHLPLPMHPDAKPAALVSMCVYEQKPALFWEFHDVVFENQQKMSMADLTSYAKKVGANEGKLKECVDSKKYEGLIDENLKYAEKLGVRSTPTFFVNGQIVAGALPINEFSEIIDRELAQAH